MQTVAAPAPPGSRPITTEQLYDKLEDEDPRASNAIGSSASNHRASLKMTSHPYRQSVDKHHFDTQEEMSDEEPRVKAVRSVEQNRSSPFHPGLGGRSHSAFTNNTSPSSIFASSQLASRPSTSTLYAASQNPNGPSKHLITVLPPAILPHDPPHPRASPFASGYGPPQNFKRGVLIPLYPTLAGQMAAIAREYGLPSTGGIVLYLLETSNAMITNGMSEAFVGGPRISDEAWALLWARLFEAEAMDAAFNESLLADSQRTEQEYYEEDIPPVPAIPRGHQNRQARQTPFSEEEPIPLSAPLSDDSSPEGTDSAYSVQADSATFNKSANSRRDQRQTRSASPSLHPAASRPPSASSHRFNPRPSSQYSGNSSPNLRNLDRSQMHNPRRASGMSVNHSFSARPSTSQSSHSARFNGRQSMLGDGPSYSSSVIVGKVEFDIDRRRGGSRWFDTYMDQASQGPGTPASASKSRFMQPNESVDFGHGQPRDSLLSKEYNRSRDHLSRPSIDASGRQELFLPTIARARSNGASDLSLDSASGESLRDRTISEESEQRTAVLEEPTIASEHMHDEAVTGEKSVSEVDAQSNDSRHSSASATSRRRSASPDSGLSSEAASDADPIGNIGYAVLQGDGEAEQVDQEVEVASSDDESVKSTAQIPQTSEFSSDMRGRDPLSDVFGTDEGAWASMKNNSEGEAAGLGIVGSEEVPSISHEEDIEDQDDVEEVKQMLEERHLGGDQQKPPQLSSPISLDVATMEPAPTSDSGFMAALNTVSPPVTTPSEEHDDPMGIMITRQSPTDAASSRAQSMMHSSSSHSLSSFASPPNDPYQGYELVEETIPEAEESVDYSQVRSQAESSSITARLQNNHPGYAEDDANASRRSSIDMHTDLDDLERALAELSPRGKKTGAMSPSFSNRSSPFGTPTSGARPLRSMYDRRHKNRSNSIAHEQPGVSLVADMPGYNESPTDSPVAAASQEEAQSQAAATQRELPPLVTDLRTSSEMTRPAMPQASEAQDTAALAALSFSPPRTSSLASKNRSMPSAMQALVPLPPVENSQADQSIDSTEDVTPVQTQQPEQHEDQQKPQPRVHYEEDDLPPTSPSNFSPVENTALAYLTSDSSALSPPSDTGSSTSKKSPKSPKGLNFGALRIGKSWSDRSQEKGKSSQLSTSQGPSTSSTVSVQSDDDGGQKSPGSFSKFKFWQRQDSAEPLLLANSSQAPPPVPQRLDDPRRSSESFQSHNSPGSLTFSSHADLPPEPSPAESNFSQNSYNSGNAYLYTNPQSLHPDFNDTEEDYKNIPDARSPSPRENRRYGFSSNPTSPVVEEFDRSDDEQRRTAAQRFYDSDRSSILSQEDDKPKERQESALV